MATEDVACSHGRVEALQKSQPLFAELLARPAGGIEESFSVLLVFHRVGAEIEGEEKVVGVAEDTRATEPAQQVDALLRLRTALGDVAERDDQVDVVARDVGERSAERNCIPVHVGEEGDSHSAELTDTP